MDWAQSLSIAAATLLTPVVVYLWGRAFPPSASNPGERAEDLKARNGWIDGVATFFMFAGLAAPIIFFWRDLNAVGAPVIGLMFGLMVIFHFVWVCLATLPFGVQRFREFWRFYELRWGIGVRGIQFVYIPIAMLGVISGAYVWANR
jgi:hypothetical protein